MKIQNTLKLALKRLLSLQFGQVTTDKAVLIWDGSENLKEGDEVFIQEEGNDEPVVAPDGEYVTEDNKTIVVVDGKVAEIRDPEAEVAPEAEAEVEAESIEAAEMEPEADPIDEPEAEEEAEATIEDRVAALEARVAEFVEGVNQIINSIAALESRIAEVEGKLASVEAPAAEPIDETPAEVEQKRSRLSYLRRD